MVQPWYPSILANACLSIIAQINLITAEHCISSVLFERWGAPSPEFTCLPVVEIFLAVVMGIPKRVVAELSTGIFVSHDLVPHIGTGVDTHLSPSGLNCCDEFFHILAVRFGGSQIPSAARTGVRFNVQPNRPSGVLKGRRSLPLDHLLKIVDQLVDLDSSIFATAREHIDVG